MHLLLNIFLYGSIMKNNKIAFFDVDGTIINTRSVFSFLEYSKEVFIKYNNDTYKNYIKTINIMLAENHKREDINRYLYTIFRGIPIELIFVKATQWYEKVSSYNNLYNSEIMYILNKHASNGVGIVLVSGSFDAVLRPIANKIGCNDILCSKLIIENNCYTGELDSAPCIGAGKALAVRKYAETNDIDLDVCFAYGDDVSDLPMIEMIKYGAMIIPSKEYMSNTFLITDWSIQ